MLTDNSMVIEELTREFADRNLRFTIGFQGACPVQAYGFIDGQRFYFRYRGGIASICIGEADPYEQAKKNLRKTVTAAQRLINKYNEPGFLEEVAQGIAEGRADALFTHNLFASQVSQSVIPDTEALDYYPDPETATFSNSVTFSEDFFSGYLTPEECAKAFRAVLEPSQSNL